MRHHPSPRKGFTVLEIMIAISIVCFLAMLAIPAIQNALRRTERTRLVREMRTTSDSFMIYAADHDGEMPPTARGTYPEGMQTYFPKNSTWVETPPGGGEWAWLWFDGSSVLGFRGFVAVLDSEFNETDLQRIDDEIDNGDISSGGVIYSSPWMLYGVN
jgi:prepilin-type N-terminal cleavage/methylation domain-containing protein